MGSQDELVELSFTKEGTAPTIQQKNVSGIPCAELRDLYFCVKFPDPLAADCMFRLLDAVEKKSAAVALEWEYADFLEQQRLARIDRTLSYCYVSLEEEESADPVGWLSGLIASSRNANCGGCFWESGYFCRNSNGSEMQCSRELFQTGSSGI